MTRSLKTTLLPRVSPPPCSHSTTICALLRTPRPYLVSSTLLPNLGLCKPPLVPPWGLHAPSEEQEVRSSRASPQDGGVVRGVRASWEALGVSLFLPLLLPPSPPQSLVLSTSKVLLGLALGVGSVLPQGLSAEGRGTHTPKCL